MMMIVKLAWRGGCFEYLIREVRLFLSDRSGEKTVGVSFA